MVNAIHCPLPLSNSIYPVPRSLMRASVTCTGYLAEDADVAMRYAELAADRGVRNAAAALANSNSSADIPDALRWLNIATGPPGPTEAEEEAACFPGTPSVATIVCYNHDVLQFSSTLCGWTM
jgi:hypothetical protein